ncbi:SPOR domain-containing protein [Mucilaginibacter sp. UR6-1]|uniref:HU domain-containing protein n=1 Tax=Mucilaginibacter sp. UR6-1 TaxID=1435643 RepID=UPI001E59F922|nr:SPOR domain-containing protein [Mucilaginibacter sp. UR6-1]MCC8408837.1 SPOR domain-containing protein [Mucilaginibacter sp. UR6-1]
MDLAYYLIDLLGQRGEVSIPGLGRFFYTRINAAYKADEARIYPPAQKLEFEQQPATGNDDFAGFISQKKNISMASARYFVDRYVNDVVQETAIRDFAVGDKGWLRNDGTRIVFKNTGEAAGSNAYFGLPALDLPKKGQQVIKTTTVILTPPLPVIVEPEVPATTTVVEQPQATVMAAVTPEPILPPVIVTPEPQPSMQYTPPVVENPEAEFVEDEKRGLNVWVITAIVIALLAIAGIGLYMYNPGLLGMGNNREAAVLSPVDTPANEVDTVTQEPETTTVKSNAADTVAQPEAQANMSLNDTVKTTLINPQAGTDKQPEATKADKPVIEKAKPVSTTAINTAPAMSYPYTVIIGGSFATVEEAERCIINYKKIGVEAHILAEPGYGKKRKVVVGTYKTLTEALKEKNKLIQSKKLREDAYTLEITKKR